MSTRIAVILAGGMGSRVNSSHSQIAKSMIPLNGKPILEYQLKLLKRYDFKKIYIITHYFHESIEMYFKDGRNLGLEIIYLKEKQALGTAGALKSFEKYFNEDFLVLYGDIVLDISIPKFHTFHLKKEAIASLIVHPNDHPLDSDLLDFDHEFFITDFYSKPHSKDQNLPNMVNAAVYYFSQKIFKYIPENTKLDFGKDIFPILIKKEKVAAYLSPEYIKDAGTPERLKKIETDLKSGKVQSFNLENKRPAIFIDRDGVMNIEKDIIHSAKDLDVYSSSIEAVKIINDSQFLSVLVTNQSVVARGLCSESQLKKIHHKLEWLMGEKGAKLDGIYYCPHHPQKGFPGENHLYKIECECRKPKIGMITKAVNDFNIDLQNSYFFGDSFRDILCAKNAGVASCGVRSGKACKDGDCEPDFMFDDLFDGIKFLLNPKIDSFCDDFIEKNILKNSSFPVLLIGGNSRSGKSSLAGLLQKKMKLKNLDVLRINLDNWILPLDQRNDQMNVFDRFQIKKIESDLLRFFKGEEIQIFPYSPIERNVNSKETNYHWNTNQIIIIEGVVSLFLKLNLNIQALKIFVDISPEEQFKRFKKFYLWKNLREEEISKLYLKRCEDEFALVEKSKTQADHIFNFN